MCARIPGGGEVGQSQGYTLCLLPHLWAGGFDVPYTTEEVPWGSGESQDDAVAGTPTLELMRKDFQERVFKHSTAPGSVFFSDTDQERQQHYCELINKRPGQKDARFTLEEMKSWSDQELQQRLFPAGFLSRFQAWKSYRDETHGDDILPFIFDGDHHPGQSAAGTDFLHC